MTRAMERSPSTFAHLSEEQIRDFFLVILNANFEGAATGETFNASGKTDILIRQGNHNIFVAECKFWDGPKKYIDTIDQLMGYITWRDTKTAILIFNRNTSFTTVLTGLQTATTAHRCYTTRVERDGEIGFHYIFRHQHDELQMIDVTILAFDIPVESK